MNLINSTVSTIAAAIKNSIIRISVIWMWVIVSVFAIDISIYILTNLDAGKDGINWYGLAAVIGAITAFVVGVLYGKLQEKKIETKQLQQDVVEDNIPKNISIPVRKNPVGGRELLKG